MCKQEAGRPERGGLSVVAEPLEELVTESVILRLGNTRMSTVRPGLEHSEVAAAIELVASTRARLDDLSSDYVRGLLTRSELSAGRNAARAEIVKAEGVIARESRSTVFSGVPIGNESLVREAWCDWTIPQRRAILGALVDTLIVMPRKASGTRFRPDRVELRFKA